MTKYEKALDSSQCALSILKSSDPDGRLIAVLYQNMGALYNYMGRFHEAVEYHKMAIEKHGEHIHHQVSYCRAACLKGKENYFFHGKDKQNFKILLKSESFEINGRESCL